MRHAANLFLPPFSLALTYLSPPCSFFFPFFSFLLFCCKLSWRTLAPGPTGRNGGTTCDDNDEASAAAAAVAGARFNALDSFHI